MFIKGKQPGSNDEAGLFAFSFYRNELNNMISAHTCSVLHHFGSALAKDRQSPIFFGFVRFTKL